MQVIELINTLEIGGAERMMVDLAHGLQQRGHRVGVVCLQDSGALAPLLEQEGIEIIEMRKGPGFQIGTVRALAKILRERRPDIVHTHNPIVHHYGVLSGRLAGVPAIINTLHGPGNLQGFGKGEAIFEASCLLTDKVAACCHAVNDHLRHVTRIAARISTVVGNGIILDRFLTAEPRKPGSPFLFGAVGRLAEVKDYPMMLDAFATVHAALPHTRLEILGDGPLRDTLEALSRARGLEGAVCFHGASLDVSSFLAGIDVFVMCSRSEGLPLTMLEAMAAARPVVGTTVGAIPELVESSGCGWLAPSGDPRQFATAMVSAARDADLPERGLRGREYVRLNHSLESMSSGYERLFEQTLLGKTTRTRSSEGRRLTKTPISVSKAHDR